MAFFSKSLVCLALCVAVSAWTYDERQLSAPSRWGEVRSQDNTLRYSTCSNVGTQSPMNLEQGSIDPSLAALQLSWIESNNYTVTNDGEDVTIEIHDVVSKLTHTTGQYQFKYAQLHTPAAHSFGGGSHDGELVLVHETDDTENDIRFVIVSVQLTASFGHHEHFSTLVDVIPQYTGTKVTASESTPLSLKKFVPTDADALAYVGSLMQPPCTEGAQYFVLRHPISVSHLQLEAIQQKRGAMATARNKRPSQGQGTRVPLRVLKTRSGASLSTINSVEDPSNEDIFAICALCFSGLCLLVTIAALLVSCCTERHDES